MSQKRTNNDKGEVLVVFSHISAMRFIAEDLGFSTVSLDYTKCSNEIERVDLLKSFLREQKQKLVLVGSSMGGMYQQPSPMRLNLKAYFFFVQQFIITNSRNGFTPLKR